jgi:hypothetical protein
MKSKTMRNGSGKIDLFLCNGMGQNVRRVAEYSTLAELKRRGKQMLRAGERCGNHFVATEFAYTNEVGHLTFEWI